MTRNELLNIPVASMTDAQLALALQCQRMGKATPSKPEQRVLKLMADHDRVDLYHLGSGLGGTQVQLVAGWDVDTRSTEGVMDRLAMRGLLAGTVVQYDDGTLHVHADCCEGGGGTLQAPAETVVQVMVRQALAG